jgi:PIN domain nuclease of toxin-antitoxin system
LKLKRMLIDTHVLIWAAGEPQKLSGRVRRMFQSGDYEVVASSVSIWEMVVKTQKGIWTFNDPTGLALRWAASLDAAWISVDPHDLYALQRLPPLHKDPFDRMLLAQAAQRSIPLITIDEKMHSYPAACRLPSKPRLEVIW